MNNVEYSLSQKAFPKGDGPPNTADAQCSSFRSGHCQVKFVWIQPWSDYQVLYTDYDTHSVVYGCDTFVGGMVKLDWLWALTRVPNAIGSAAHSLMKTTIFKVITDRLEDFDPEDRLRPTEQTVAKGCEYSKYPIGWEDLRN